MPEMYNWLSTKSETVENIEGFDGTGSVLLVKRGTLLNVLNTSNIGQFQIKKFILPGWIVFSHHLD